MSQKITVTPLADITSLMSGTTAPWLWDVEQVYVNQASVPYTWVDGVLDVPGYSSGVVLIQFTIYLLYDEVSQYFPLEPPDPLSPLVYWENRLRSFFSVSSTIRNFEKGLTDVTGGSIAINLDDDWIVLNQVPVIFSNMTVRVYTDDHIVFKGTSISQSYNDYVLSLSVQKRQTILEAECHWGDPPYLNRIDRSSVNPFYNGANIPEKYEGSAIPMLFGQQTPYEQDETGEIELGTPVGLFLVPPSTKAPERGINKSAVIVKIIPTSATTGIIGRMPSYQTLTSTPVNTALTGSTHVFSRTTDANNAFILTDMIEGECCSLERTVAPTMVNSARLYRKTATKGLFFLGADDATLPTTGYSTIFELNLNFHFFFDNVPGTNWVPAAVLSGTFTRPDNQNRWLTVSGFGGVNLLEQDCYVVITGINGAKTWAEVMGFALESHGFTVDVPSFTALAADLPYPTIQQCGEGKNIPTLGAFVAELNEPLMTVLVFPASNDIPFLIKINPTAPAAYSLTDVQIANLQSSEEYRGINDSVIFEPKYARSDAQLNSLFVKEYSNVTELFNAEQTKTILHSLTSTPARFDEVTQIYGSPQRLLTFDLLDDDVAIELGDMVQLEHPEYRQKILIVSIASKPVGRTIQGRFLYVNNN